MVMEHHKTVARPHNGTPGWWATVSCASTNFHVLTVWPLTSTLACLVTKQCLMVFDRQTFIICPGSEAD